ncbi:MAG: Maf family protein [Halanaerobiales bacterium]|nr:Maf family protein [Halanaerobiales bacterium]
MNNKIILASSSNRRKELLNRLNIKFTTMPSNIDESNCDMVEPEKLVQKLSLRKAFKVANIVENAVVISADTVVVFDNKILNKPDDEQDASRMLKLLSDNVHYVYTGIALISTGDDTPYLDFDKTEVEMRKIDDNEIERYIKTGEPMDKAGSYAIQSKGGIFVKRITGSYFTVMGLPIHKLSIALKSFNIEII